ncbi:DEAD/DEAH box helicase [Deminuibacter soli]|uniref:ATP-dependent helicase n=1 Tax=Deminuibacter soli TaxID=2291815 RepID=A0A3E1NQK1_9BACT|nr:DEAD/DEAH box helicase [Deminuibacter soli]RFM30206.1 ATP-dependent helicase [Deminuibacter soli]
MQDPEQKKSKKTIILPAVTTDKGSSKSKKKTTHGLLIDLSKKQQGAFKIAGLLVAELNGSRDYKTFPLVNEISLFDFKSMPVELYRIIYALTADQINAQKNWLTDQYREKMPEGFTEEAYVQKGIQTYLYNIFQQLRPFAGILKWYYQVADDLLPSNMVIKPAAISNFSPAVAFELLRTYNGVLRMQTLIRINNHPFLATDFKRYGFLLQSKNEFFILSLKDAQTMDHFPNGYIDVAAGKEKSFIADTITPLAQQYTVNQDILMQEETIDVLPQPRVYFSELNGSFLMISIRWQYGEFEIEDNADTRTTIVSNQTRFAIQRYSAVEEEARSYIRSLHPKFAQQRNDYFYLSFSEAEKNQWFVKFYRKLIDRNIPVYGMNQMQHFRYNTHVPVIKVEHKGNGIDWFDLYVEISYGDQQIAIADLQKALLNRQPYLLLKDGTLGMIPEEWQHKLGLLLKIGHLQNNSQLRLSKLHWTLAQDLQDGDKLVQQIITPDYISKWEQLQQNGHNLFKVPATLNASLRDYQKAGFEWMCLLDEMQWGGCLADDMGLGKTLQTISFLHYQTEKYPADTHLVICPTSLMYNWQTELQKFSPHLSYRIYHGPSRSFNVSEFENTQIIITSYGTVRSDLEQLAAFKFGYIVCDESQIIKNAGSQVAKAVLQLQSRNRLVLSGTPIQNNTFDLYTQMHFINPGLLGNKEFFRSEFALPIDKFGDKEAAAKLRKMIYPFMLRRTKEQVAKDLPPKTEITLWCEMEEEQRQVYDEYKNHYRSSLLERIEKEGIGSSSVYILEGLTRLRQICNAPQLVKNATHSATESVKLKALMEEIRENMGTHKALVFSQFTGMLQLIADEMTKEGISYFYLDGSTKAEERQVLVNRFQQEADVQVFLISLKAGGVGLTLTAADYVYLVDPWWNPAAEQQAIDRAHRIGQQQKVFAYKMICRDSVEEKILALQQRKKALAADLISEESGFVKSLSTEDIAFLFS